MKSAEIRKCQKFKKMKVKVKKENVKMSELVDEEMYVLCAPDGFPQTQTLAPSFVTCVAMLQMMAETGMVKPFPELMKAGCSILPVKVTMKQNGTEDEFFKKAKSELSKL